MKHRAISLITALALCLSLCPVRALAAGDGDLNSIAKITFTEDSSNSVTFDVTEPLLFDMCGYSYTVSKQTAISVKGAGRLYLTTGTIQSENGAGIEILTGGGLYIDEPGLAVIGATYGLDIASGAAVELSGGTFTGGTAALYLREGGDYGALLASTDVTRYAYYDEAGKPIALADVGGKTTVTVKECTDHKYSYTHDEDAPMHDGACIYCGAKVESAPCTFDFDANGSAACADCKRVIKIDVTTDDDSLVYNGYPRPESVSVAVMLDGDENKTLNENTDYTVAKITGTNAGELIAVTVTGKTYNGAFTQFFSVAKAKPEIAWETAGSGFDKPYDGNPINEAALLQKVNITGIYAGDSEALKNSVQFSYQKAGGTDFTPGLPTDAGTYQIKASLPALPNYEAAETYPCLELTISKIPTAQMVPTPPEATKPVYNKTEQKLVTSGTVNPNAVGAVILFATSQNGPWSTDIPIGIYAGADYKVWYMVEGTGNYEGVAATEIEGVEIQRKPITPDIVLEYTSYVYTGSAIQPKVTAVSDTQDGTVLPVSEYDVEYSDNTNVGTNATVTIKDKAGGNYQVATTTVKFTITEADQAELMIANAPATVFYGDEFVLNTTGGSGDGEVTWEIIYPTPVTNNDAESSTEIAKIDKKSGKVTVTGVGIVTVRAAKSGSGYKEMSAEWTFNAEKKPVTATVTAEDKVYNGSDTATVTAVVEQGVVSGDTITITGLSGTFSDANAGAGKTVTVDTSGAKISGTNSGNYSVTYSSRTVKASITKAATEITEAPASKTPALTYSGEPQELVGAATAAPTTNVGPSGETVVVEYALSAGGPYSTYIPQATDAGSYEVWYRVQETNNYFGTAAEKVEVTISSRAVSNPTIELSKNSYEYDGTEKKPDVTVKDGNDVIPASEYTVTYSNNVNVGEATGNNPPTVTVTDNAGGNYKFDPVTEHFSITSGGSAVLTSSPQARNLTYNGQPQDLVTVGTASGGSLVYAWKEGNGVPAENEYKETIPQGTNAGLYKVYYKVKGDNNHTDSASACVYVTIQPKTVTSPVITLPDKTFTYNGSAQTYTDGETKQITVKDGTEPIPATEYTVTYSNNVNAGTATVHIIDNNGGNYDVSGSATFEIKKATAGFSTNPSAQTGLTYNGKAQPLITAGVPVGGTAVYWLEGGAYSTAIPTGTDCKTYTVWAKVLGDANHEDSAPQKVGDTGVTIGVNAVSYPNVELSSRSFQYNGSEQKPTVTVRDDNWNIIPANEYTVQYGNTDQSTVNEGTYTITITCKTGGNYSFSVQTATVTILPAGQTPLTITGKPNVVYYGDTIQLSATGGSGNGTVTWSITSGGEYATIGENTGLVKVTGAGGSVTITATRKSGNYADIADTWTFYANKRTVTAVVTAADKTYDGTDTAELSVAVPGTDLVISSVTGTFADENVGINKRVTINSETATKETAYYVITYPTTTTASITPAAASLTGVTVSENTPTYNGGAQALVTVSGTVTDGYPAYSLDGTNYSRVIPTGTDAKKYTVWYKVIGDSNHTDSEAKSVEVTITAKTVTDLEVLCTPGTFIYDGNEKTPSVIVMDGNREVPASEYNVAYSSNVNVGTSATVTVTDKEGGNYSFTGKITATFEIQAASQNPFSIVTGTPTNVYYGDTFRLSAAGGSGTGTVRWNIKESDAAVAEITQDGAVTVKGIGDFTVTAYRDTDGSYSKSNEYSVSFVAAKKPVAAVVTAANKVYDGNKRAELTVTVPGTDLVISGVTGTFDNENVGTNKTVTIDHNSATVDEANQGKYDITYPATTTASITPAATSLTGITVTKNTPTYNGGAQALVTVSGTVTDGYLAYSLDGVSYSLDIPTGINAGTYTVRYKVLADSNHTDSEVKTVEVTIGKATPAIGTSPVASSIKAGQKLSESILTGGQALLEGRVEVPGTFTWTEDSDNPTTGTSYPVTFTPDDRTNFEKSENIMVQVTVEPAEAPDDGDDDAPGTGDPEPPDTPSTPGTNTPSTPSAPSTTPEPDDESPSIQTSVQDGTASTVVNGAAGDELVNEAVANQSEAVVIKPEITGNVTRTEVSLPAAAVSRLSRETNAALTVSTPVADVTIPNGSLETLSAAGDSIGIVTERVENALVLTLTADGQELGAVTGGLTLTVPMEDAGPGTVAVVIHEDGTRETVRWSVATDGAVRIPLNGSVTVEIVDNSKEFADVSSGSWVADAVAFASAREIFSGTGEAAFSPNLVMSRAMLATMLYNLEGRPEQELTNEFGDVDNGAWYAAGISWAAANGIASGYGDGQFGPNDSMTREELAVMFWRYAGSPTVEEQALPFTDADQVSGYAMEALCWAAASGLMCGDGAGHLDPTGLTTRAQAAQMLKNFMENI